MKKNQKDNQDSNYQSNFFEDNAGPEELAHLQDLIDRLTDKELKTLAERVGIKFCPPRGKTTPRRDYEVAIDESDREDFYREYKKIIMSNKIVSVPIDKVKKYLRETGFYKNPTATKVRDIFNKNLKKYLHGEISASFFSALAEEILYENVLPKGIIDIITDDKLLSALENASELVYLRSQMKALALAEDTLKSYYKKIKGGFHPL